MSLYVSELYVRTVAKGLLDPTERLVASTTGNHTPFWTNFLPFLIPFFTTQFLVLATSHRVVLVRHRKGFLTGDRMDNVESIAWRDVETTKIAGLLFKKRLVIKGTAHKVEIELAKGINAPKDNVANAQAVVATWERTKSLPAGAAERGMLPNA